jgi:hypothetical protein
MLYNHCPADAPVIPTLFANNSYLLPRTSLRVIDLIFCSESLESTVGFVSVLKIDVPGFF